MDSPLTTAECNRCITSLKQDNRREEANVKQGALIYLVWSVMFGLPFWSRPAGLTKSQEIASAVFCLEGVALWICVALLNWFVFRKIAECMRRHAAPIFSQTALVKYVMSVPSAAVAYHHWFYAWIADGFVLGKQRPYGLERGVKAVCTRFGAWARYFGHSPEPWAVRTAIYTISLSIIGGGAVLNWYMNLPHVRERFLNAQGEIPLAFWLGMCLLAQLILWISVFYGRRAGIRRALIEYFDTVAVSDEAAHVHAALVAAAEAKLLPLSRDV